jgi:(2Fe-2S) ferredoxin
MAHRKRYLFVCQNRRPDGVPKGSCAARGSEQLLEELKLMLRDKGLAKVEARACGSTCLDACLAGPVISVEPDHFFYGRVTAEDLPEIVDALSRGERVERLVLKSEDYEA